MLGYFGKNIASRDTPVIKGGNFSLLQSHAHKLLGGLHMHSNLDNKTLDAQISKSHLNNKTLHAQISKVKQVRDN